MFCGPSVDCRSTSGLEQLPARQAGESAEGDWSIRRAEGRGPDLRGGTRQRLGEHTERRHVGGFSLVSGHAGGRVALDVFDRRETLANSQAYVLGSCVVLEVDKRSHT